MREFLFIILVVLVVPNSEDSLLRRNKPLLAGLTVFRRPSASPAALMALNPGIRLLPASGASSCLIFATSSRSPVLLSIVLRWRYRAVDDRRYLVRTLLRCVCVSQFRCSARAPISLLAVHTCRLFAQEIPRIPAHCSRNRTQNIDLVGIATKKLISRVFPTHGDNIAISNDGIKCHMLHTSN